MKVLRDKKATRSMKKMAIKVFRRIRNKLQQVQNHSQHHAQRHHVEHHARGHHALRHHAQRHHNVHRVTRHSARRANKKMSITVKKHISPNKIVKLSKAIGQKILRVAKTHKNAGRVAKKICNENTQKSQSYKIYENHGHQSS